MAIFKPVFSEDNWQEILFDDSKLEGHSLPYDGLKPDPNNPYFKRIQLNRDIHFQWEEYCEKQHDRSEIDSDLDIQYGINLAHILLHNPDLPSMSSYASNDKLVYAAQRYAVETYDHKGLYFHVKIAEAIAKPDEWSVTPEEITLNHVMVVGRYGYDLSINLTLTNSDFGKLKEASAFFFAMKVRQVDLMSIDDFLDYQLEASYLGDELRFGRFLNLLCKKYGSPDETHGFDALLKKELVDSLLEWVSLPKTQVEKVELVKTELKETEPEKAEPRKAEPEKPEPEKAEPEKVEPENIDQEFALVEFIDNSLGRRFDFSDHNLEAIKQLLNPFFDETDQPRLAELLKGGEVSTKLFFRAESVVISFFFRMLLEGKVIDANSTQMKEWLVNTFSYKSNRTQGPSDLKPSTFYDSLTKDREAKRNKIEFEILRGEIQVKSN